MQKNLEIKLSVDAKTGEVTAVRNSFDDVDRQVDRVNKNLSATKGNLLALAAGAGIVYGLKQAFDFAVQSGWEYNASMDASTAKLTAMVSASKGYVTTSGEQVSAMERQALVAAEVSDMMQILEEVNAQTSMGMSELVDIYAIAKPGMDRYRWALEDQIEIVKLASNTASAFNMTGDELTSGIDDLAAGTWEATSGFGKMMKAVGASKEEYQAAGDKVAYLKDKFKETGEAQDTMAAATSNLDVAWGKMSGRITQPVFDGAKEGIKGITELLNEAGPDSMQIFADALVDMVNGGISTIAFLAKAINEVVGLLQISYSGFQKLSGLAMGGDISEVQAQIKELERKQKTGDWSAWDKFTGANGATTSQAEINALRQKIEDYKYWNSVREAGDKNHEEALQRIEKINGMINKGVEKITLKRSQLADPIEEAVKPGKELASAISDVAENGDKSAKSLKKQEDAARSLYKEYLKLTGQESELFQFDVEETLSKFIASGKYSAEQLSDIYDGMWAKYAEHGKSANNEVVFDFMNMLSDASSAFAENGDIGGAIRGMIDSGIDALRAGAAGPYGQIAGYTIELVRGLFGTDMVSQAEIDASMGQVDFSDNSLINLENVFADVQYPMLEVASKMFIHIRNMDANFHSVARAMNAEASAGGVDLTGANFVETMKTGFLGFSSKSVSLIGTGLKFELQTLSEMMQTATLDVRAYTTTLVQKSSFFGLSNSSKIKEAYKDLPSDVVEDIANAFSEGFKAIMLAGTTLGIDQASLEDMLLNSEISLGKNEKIDFTGLSQDEVADRMSQLFSTALSGVVNNVEDFSVLVGRYAKNTEESLETLVRIATEYDQSGHMFSLIGKDFFDVTTTIETEMSRSVDRWGNIVNETALGYERELDIGGDIITQRVNNFVAAFIGIHEETWTEIAEAVTQQVYTAQMQMLDIVESAGGQQSFNDAMGAFMSGFFTEDEQTGFLTKSMEASFSGLGLIMPDITHGAENAKEAFKDLLYGIDTSTEEGSYLFGQVLLLADGFGKLTSAIGDGIDAMYDDQIAEERNRLESAIRSQVTEMRNEYETRMAVISSLQQSRDALLPQAEVSVTSIREKMKNWTLESNSEIESMIRTLGQQRIDSYRKAEDARVKSINKEIDLSNKLYDTIKSAQDSVQNSFIGIMGSNSNVIGGGFYDAMATKDYKNIGSAFTRYAQDVMDRTGGSLEGMLEIAYANRDVQQLNGPAYRSPVEINTAAIETNTKDINVQMIALYDELIALNEAAVPNVEVGIQKLYDANKEYFGDGSEFVKWMERGATDITAKEQAEESRKALDTIFFAQAQMGEEQLNETKMLRADVDRLIRKFDDMNAINQQIADNTKSTAVNTEKSPLETGV